MNLRLRTGKTGVLQMGAERSASVKLDGLRASSTVPRGHFRMRSNPEHDDESGVYRCFFANGRDLCPPRRALDLFIQCIEFNRRNEADPLEGHVGIYVSPALAII
jgi:hypothetical protein